MKMPEVVNDDVVDERMMKYTKAYINKISGIRRRVYIYVCIDRVCVYVYFTFNLSQNSLFSLSSPGSQYF